MICKIFWLYYLYNINTYTRTKKYLCLLTHFDTVHVSAFNCWKTLYIIIFNQVVHNLLLYTITDMFVCSYVHVNCKYISYIYHVTLCTTTLFIFTFLSLLFFHKIHYNFDIHRSEEKKCVEITFSVHYHITYNCNMLSTFSCLFHM